MGSNPHVEVDAGVLYDLCGLLDELSDHGYLDDVPEPLADGIRGGVAELRCHSLATT